jgi:hypothetical protein
LKKLFNSIGMALTSLLSYLIIALWVVMSVASPEMSNLRPSGPAKYLLDIKNTWIDHLFSLWHVNVSSLCHDGVRGEIDAPCQHHGTAQPLLKVCSNSL